MVKMVFSCRFPKDKNDADFSKNILQMQEKVEPDLFTAFHTHRIFFVVNENKLTMNRNTVIQISKQRNVWCDFRN